MPNPSDYSAGPRLREVRVDRLRSGEPLTISRVARNCIHPQCSVTLSRYNPSATCAVHGGWADAPPRTRSS